MLVAGGIYKVIVKGQAYGIVDSSNLAPVEEGAIATLNYTTGEYVIFDGNLCITNTAIPIGTTFSTEMGGNLTKVKVGSEMMSLKNQITQGLAAVNERIDGITLPIANANTLGGVKIGSGVNVDSEGKISVPTPTPYTLPIAGISTLGGIMVGKGLKIESNGKLLGNNALYKDSLVCRLYSSRSFSPGWSNGHASIPLVLPTIASDLKKLNEGVVINAYANVSGQGFTGLIIIPLYMTVDPNSITLYAHVCNTTNSTITLDPSNSNDYVTLGFAMVSAMNPTS